jgi:hypothetical protein
MLMEYFVRTILDCVVLDGLLAYHVSECRPLLVVLFNFLSSAITAWMLH